MELATLMTEEMREFPHGGGARAVWLVRIDGDPRRPVLRVPWRDDGMDDGGRHPGPCSGAVAPPLSLLQAVGGLLSVGRSELVAPDSEATEWLVVAIPRLPAPGAGKTVPPSPAGDGPMVARESVAGETGEPVPAGVLAVLRRRDPAWDEAFRLWLRGAVRRVAPVLAAAPRGAPVRSPLQPTLFPAETVAGEPVPATGARGRRRERALPLPRPRFGCGLPGVVGVSRELRACCHTIRAVAAAEVNVLLQGESGTGKEVLARALHLLSGRREGPFVGVNCAALPESLFESELFGHKAGAFTGAGKEKAGLLEAADGGTFFLDEIGDMPLPLQIKLLRVMQERRLRRIGDLRDRPVDARFVAASHKDLAAEIQAGRFRLDLFYRLKVVSVAIPPLRQRPEDVIHLLAWFLRRLGLPEGELAIEERALHALQRYRWPGNVRELQNEVARWAALHGDEGVIRLEHLSPEVRRQQGLVVDPADLAILRPVEEATELLEQYLIRKAIAASGGRKAAAARRLGLSRQGLYKKIKRYGMGDLLHAS